MDGCWNSGCSDRGSIEESSKCCYPYPMFRHRKVANAQQRCNSGAFFSLSLRWKKLVEILWWSRSRFCFGREARCTENSLEERCCACHTNLDCIGVLCGTCSQMSHHKCLRGHLC